MTRWIKAATSLSFRLKLMIASVACILIPTCITLFASNAVTEKAMRQQALDNARSTLQLVDGYVSNLLDFMLYVVNYIQVDAEINVVLREQARERPAGTAAGGAAAEPGPVPSPAPASSQEYKRFVDEYYTVIKKLDNLSIAGGEQYFITILLPNGKSYTNYPLDEWDPNRWREEPWFGRLQALRGFDTYWVGTQPTVFRTLKKTHPYQLSVARPLRTASTEIYAYVIVTVLEDQISYIFQRLAGGQEIALIDDSGFVHSHTDPAKIGSVMRDLPSMASGFFRLDGEDYLIAREDLTYADWSLVLLSPYKEAIAGVNNMNRAVFVYLIASFLAFMILLIFLIGTFTKPLKRLGRLAETVQRGNLQVRSHIRGRDEIGYLGTSFDQMLDRINVMIAEITAEQTKKRKAELAMLQAQVNPHFLFNVLNSIRMNILRKGDRENAEVIGSLSRLLRMTIEQERELILLGEEIELAAHYVRLMNMRRRDNAELVLDIPEEALSQPVPRLILQPLIENALIHGLKQGGGVIRVSVRMAPDRMVIEVRDDGAGMEPEKLERLRAGIASSSGTSAASGLSGASGFSVASGFPDVSGFPGVSGFSGHSGFSGAVGFSGPRERDRDAEKRRGFSGIGLTNVHERLRFIYGGGAEMRIDAEKHRGTTVTLVIPREEVSAVHVQSHAGG